MKKNFLIILIGVLTFISCTNTDNKRVISKKNNQNVQQNYKYEQVKIAQILIRTSDLNSNQKKEAKLKAENLLERVKNGENFYDLAKNYSEAPEAKWNGIIGYISRGDMIFQIEEASFNGNIGVYPDLIETKQGYHIILIIDKKNKI